MLPGKTATKKAAVVPPTIARAGCFHVAISAPPRASSTMPEATTTVSGSAGNHDGTCAWNSWRCLVRWPVPAMSSPAPSATWATALRARRAVEWVVIDAPSSGDHYSRSKERRSSQSVTARLNASHSWRAVLRRWWWTSSPNASRATSLASNRSMASTRVDGMRVDVGVGVGVADEGLARVEALGRCRGGRRR